MKGYYLRIKNKARYKAFAEYMRRVAFVKAKKNYCNFDFEDKNNCRKLDKWHRRYCARYYEKANALREHRLCRYIRGERNYYG